MTRLPESSTWEDEIELISRSERVSGGLDGVANRPLIALASRTRHLKDKADESGELVAEKVSAIKTFAEGATLGSPREEILYGAYRLVWTGDFPKTVEAGSTPQETGGIGAGSWAYTSDAAIRQDLSSEKKGDGASIVALEQGGTLQNAITWLTPEAFGGGVGVEDNGPALRAIAEQAAANNTIPYVRFSGRTYRVKTKVVFDRAVIFEGVGALHGSLLADTIHESDKIQRCSTLIKDAREFDTSDFLFEFKDGVRPVLGVAFRGVEFVGASVNDAPETYKTCGVFIDISGWVTSSSNLLVRDFGLTGLKVNHNDGVWNNTSVLRCGGKLDGTVYYALDLKREDGSGTFTNQHKFNNPHIEHCRYAIRCSGYMNLFHGGHLELNDDSFTPDGDPHPVVLFEQLTYPVTFDKMTCISPATLRYLDGYAATTDPAQLAANLAALPAFFGGVPGSVIDPTSDTFRAFIRFDGCDMTNASKPVKWFDIPDVRILIDGCHITRAATWSSALKLGHNSKITNTFIQTAVVTGNTSDYAALVNNVWSVPVMGYGHITASDVTFARGNAAYACFSAAGGGGSANTRLTSILRGDYGFTIGTVIGDYVSGYVASYNGFRVQSADGASNVLVAHDRLTSSTGGYTIGSVSYTVSRVGVIANIDGNGNFWAPTANDRNWLGARAAANSWNGVFTKAFFMGAASPDGYWQAGLYPTAAAAYSIGTTVLPVNNIYLQNSPIIISDATHKVSAQDVEALLISAVGSVKFQMWKMKKAVTEKGEDAARWHVGVIAQQVRDALIAAGLDWTSYGLITYEEVEIEVVRDGDGNLTPADPDQNLIEVDTDGFVSIQSDQDTVTEKNGALYFTTGVYMLRMEEFLALRMAYIESQLP